MSQVLIWEDSLYQGTFFCSQWSGTFSSWYSISSFLLVISQLFVGRSKIEILRVDFTSKLKTRPSQFLFVIFKSINHVCLGGCFSLTGFSRLPSCLPGFHLAQKPRFVAILLQADWCQAAHRCLLLSWWCNFCLAVCDYKVIQGCCLKIQVNYQARHQSIIGFFFLFFF